ncbi:MAG: tail fiber protein [Clostridia bacterium]|nr:tail fiber protein [Clostridia bacterium]
MDDMILLAMINKIKKGGSGGSGIQGPPGAKVQLRVEDGVLQQKYDNESRWTDLIDLKTLNITSNEVIEKLRTKVSGANYDEATALLTLERESGNNVIVDLSSLKTDVVKTSENNDFTGVNVFKNDTYIDEIFKLEEINNSEVLPINKAFVVANAAIGDRGLTTKYSTNGYVESISIRKRDDSNISSVAGVSVYSVIKGNTRAEDRVDRLIASNITINFDNNRWGTILINQKFNNEVYFVIKAGANQIPIVAIGNASTGDRNVNILNANLVSGNALPANGSHNWTMSMKMKCGTDYKIKNKKSIVIAVAGQSNAVGYDESPVYENIHRNLNPDRLLQLGIYGDENLKLIPLGHHAHSFQDMRSYSNPATPKMKGTKGLHLPLGNLLLNELPEDCNIVFVSATYGGTGFTTTNSYGTYNENTMLPSSGALRWGVDSAYYKALKNRIKYVLDLHPNNFFGGVIWVQGEHDNNNAEGQRVAFEAMTQDFFDFFNNAGYGSRTPKGTFGKYLWYNVETVAYWYSVGQCQQIWDNYKAWSPNSYVKIPRDTDSNAINGTGSTTATRPSHYGNDAYYKVISSCILDTIKKNGAIPKQEGLMLEWEALPGASYLKENETFTNLVYGLTLNERKAVGANGAAVDNNNFNYYVIPVQPNKTYRFSTKAAETFNGTVNIGGSSKVPAFRNSTITTGNRVDAFVISASTTKIKGRYYCEFTVSNANANYVALNFRSDENVIPGCTEEIMVWEASVNPPVSYIENTFTIPKGAKLDIEEVDLIADRFIYKENISLVNSVFDLSNTVSALEEYAIVDSGYVAVNLFNPVYGMTSYEGKAIDNQGNILDNSSFRLLKLKVKPGVKYRIVRDNGTTTATIVGSSFYVESNVDISANSIPNSITALRGGYFALVDAPELGEGKKCLQIIITNSDTEFLYFNLFNDLSGGSNYDWRSGNLMMYVDGFPPLTSYIPKAASYPPRFKFLCGRRIGEISMNIYDGGAIWTDTDETWIKCDGNTSINKIDYPELYALLVETYNPDDNATIVIPQIPSPQGTYCYILAKNYSFTSHQREVKTIKENPKIIEKKEDIEITEPKIIEEVIIEKPKEIIIEEPKIIEEVKIEEPKNKVRITANILNVRKQPYQSASTIAIVKKGDICCLSEIYENWGKLENGAGWINLNFTEKI